MWCIINISFVLLCIIKNSEGIVNGKEATPHQFPYQALILSNFRNGHFKYCGGSLISTTTVLTSAQCLTYSLNGEIAYHYPKELEVRLGCIEANCKKGKSFKILDKEDVIVHPGYDGQSFKNDIALIKLPKTIETDSSIKVIDLDYDSASHINEKCTASGWGAPHFFNNYHQDRKLHYVDLKVISKKDCDLLDSTMCTSKVNDAGEPVGLCNGDIGDPLVSGGKQIAIASYHPNDCGENVNFPSIFTRVSTFKKWIQMNSSNNIDVFKTLIILSFCVLVLNIF